MSAPADGPASLQVRRVPLRGLGAEDRAAWQDLVDRAVEPNPFFEPAYAEPAARNLPGGDRAELLVVAHGGRWLGALPVRTQPKWSDLYAPCVRTWNHPYSFLWTPLVDAASVEPVARALRAALPRFRGRSFLALENLTDGPVARAVLDAPDGPTAPFVHGDYERAVVRRRPEDTYVAEHVTGKHRREVRRTRRVLEKTLEAPVELVDGIADPDALDRFLALEAGGWKGEAGSALASDPDRERFFREMVAGFTAAGRAHLLELRGGDRTAASVFCLRAGDEVFALKIGYDESLGRGAPGIHLMADLATWFHERTDAATLDSCAIPDHPMINGLWPDRRRHLTAILPARGLAGRAVRALERRMRPRREAANREAAG